MLAGTTDALNKFFTVNMPVYTPCQTMHEAWVQTRDLFCCDVITTATYHTVSWFAYGVVTAILGIPCAILGFKRFPNHIWVRAAVFFCSSVRFECIHELNYNFIGTNVFLIMQSEYGLIFMPRSPVFPVIWCL